VTELLRRRSSRKVVVGRHHQQHGLMMLIVSSAVVVHLLRIAVDVHCPPVSVSWYEQWEQGREVAAANLRRFTIAGPHYYSEEEGRTGRTNIHSDDPSVGF